MGKNIICNAQFGVCNSKQIFSCLRKDTVNLIFNTAFAGNAGLRIREIVHPFYNNGDLF